MQFLLPIRKVFGLQNTNLALSDVEMFKAPKSPQNTSNVTENEFRIVEVTTGKLTNSLTNTLMKKLKRSSMNYCLQLPPAKCSIFHWPVIFFKM